MTRTLRGEGSRAATLGTAVLTCGALLLVYAPLAWLVVESFRADSSASSKRFDLRWYDALGRDRVMLAASFRSLVVAFGSAALATLFGTAGALGLFLARMPRTRRRRLRLVLELPWAIPDLLLGVLVLVGFAILRRWLPFLSPGLVTLTIGQTIAQLSIVVLVVSSQLRAIGPDQLEAARDLHATPLFALRRVLLPQVTTAILGAFLLAFTFSIDDFILGFFLSGPESVPLPVVLHARLKRGATPEIYAISTLVLAWTAAAAVTIAMLARERRSDLRTQRVPVLLFSALLLAPLAALGLSARGSLAVEDARPLSLLLYSEYIDPSLLAEFERETGHSVALDFYESQEEMVGKLRTFGAGQYDLVVASDAVVPQMRALGLVQPLDRGRLPGLAHLDETLLDPWFDPGSKHSVPYLWGTTGLLYRRADFPKGAPDVREIFESVPKRYRFALLDEGRTMLGFALVSQGRNPNTRAAEDVAAAMAALQGTKRSPACLGFDGSVANVTKVERALASVAFVYSGDAARVLAERTDLAFAIPAEGGFRWIDVLAIPVASRSPDLAHRFIDFLLRPDNAHRLAAYVRYGTPNRTAQALFEDSGPTLDPDATARLSALVDVETSQRLYEEAWTLVKAD